MCSTELLLWENQKGYTRYLMTLYKRDSTADIFLETLKFFFGQGFSQNNSKPLIAKGFYKVRMSNGYCFRRVAQGQLSQCNRRNTAIVLRAVVKSYKVLNETKEFACGCSRRNLKNFSKLTAKSPCWSTFIL